MKARCLALAALTLGLFSFTANAAGTGGEIEYFSDLQLPARELSVPAANPAAPVPLETLPGKDLTAQFDLAWAANRAPSGKELAELRKCKVLLVRGFMTGGYVKPIIILGKKVEVGGYFRDQMRALEELGVEFTLVDVDSVMPPAHNAKKVAAEIAASAKPVILISHSDGGMYVLQALVENKKLLPQVRAFIPLQAPFLGSPVADYVKRHAPLLASMTKLLSHFGGTVDSLNSLGTVERDQYQRDNTAAIREIISGVKVISVAACKDEEKDRLDTLLELPRDLLLGMGLASDGLVPVQSAILPGSDYVKLAGVDHIVSVMRTDSILKFDRSRLTKTLLLMTL